MLFGTEFRRSKTKTFCLAAVYIKVNLSHFLSQSQEGSGSSRGPHPVGEVARQLPRPQPHRDRLGMDEEEAGGPQLHQHPAVEGGNFEGVAGEDRGVPVPAEPGHQSLKGKGE